MEKSIFSPDVQARSVESKITAALERISWIFKLLLSEQSRAQGLSPTQLQILIFCAYHPQNNRTITYLAAEFNLTKATISDSVKVLTQKELVRKVYSANDFRSFTLCLTPRGNELAEVGALYANEIYRPIIGFPQQRKEDLLTDLLAIINRLQKTGVIPLNRMCFTCGYYEDKQGTHFCNLMQVALMPAELRLDCPEHVMEAVKKQKQFCHICPI